MTFSACRAAWSEHIVWCMKTSLLDKAQQVAGDGQVRWIGVYPGCAATAPDEVVLRVMPFGEGLCCAGVEKTGKEGVVDLIPFCWHDDLTDSECDLMGRLIADLKNTNVAEVVRALGRN